MIRCPGKTILFALIFITHGFSFSQTHTVGTLSYDPSISQAGYNLFFPHRQGTVFLTDPCGEVVHDWPDVNWEPGEAVHLMEDGSIFIAKSRGILSNPWIQGGGGGEKIEHRDWDNNLLWSFTWNDSLHRMHHDFDVLPNGNVIFISWEWKTQLEALAEGRDSTLLPVGYLLPDYLLEVKPIGIDSGEIVWEWHAWDHLIQDHDSSKANYGVVGNHSELIDLNFTWWQSTSDWLHTNSIDYNPALDMIMLSVPTFNEVWIIDHSTSLAEAAGHTGGQSGKGGDLLYRWGNPITYRQGTLADQKFFLQHDLHWLSSEVPSSDLFYNGVGLFNNQVAPGLSTVDIFTPAFDSATWSFDTLNGRFLPTNFDWTYFTPDSALMYSAVVSGMQRLQNGNTLIFAGRKGYALEIDSIGNFAWQYVLPFNLGQPVSQGDVVPLSGNFCFRMRRYAPDFPGFNGHQLIPHGFIELNADTAFCDSILNFQTESIADPETVSIFPNPANEQVELKMAHTHSSPVPLTITDALGRMIISTSWRGEMNLNVSTWPLGIYFIYSEERFAGKLAIVR
jgi:Arylsulfotransferase (ASST)/Secretion system C-terminal sorting domain